jgi:hypothetical protein
MKMARGITVIRKRPPTRRGTLLRETLPLPFPRRGQGKTWRIRAPPFFKGRIKEGFFHFLIGIRT